MGEHVRIKTFNLSRLNNAEYFTFMLSALDLVPKKSSDEGEPVYPDIQSLSSLISEMDPSLIGVSPDLLERISDDMNALENAVNGTRTSIESAQVSVHEQNRDNLINYIMMRINSSSSLPLADEQEAGQILIPVIKPYAGITRIPVQQETAQVKGMIRDLKSSQYAEYTTRLGLDSYLDELEKENNAYQQLTVQRLQSQEANKIESGTSIRSRLDEEYDDFILEAQSFNIMSGTDVSAKFVNEMNRLISRTLTLNKMRKSGSTTDETVDDNPDDGGNDGNDNNDSDLPVVQ